MKPDLVPLRMPEYMRRYRCAGTECKYCCCNVGWPIYIDWETYEKYLACDNVHLREKLKNNIDVHRGDLEEADYARIRMTKSGCPFLSDVNLCSIHFQLGVPYQPTVCAQYPQVTNRMGDTGYEMSASVSCAAVARLVLSARGGLRVVDTTMNADTAAQFLVYHQILNPDPEFGAVRAFCLEILKNRNFPIWQRLIILGVFLRKATECRQAGKRDAIVKRLADFSRIIERGRIVDLLPDIPATEGVQRHFLNELAAVPLQTSFNNTLFDQCFSAFKKGIEYGHGKESTARVMRAYRHAETMYFQPVVQRNTHVFENYLINHALNTVFPFGADDMFEEYRQMVLRCILVKMLLVGMAGYYKQAFKMEHVIQLVCSFSRQIDHNPDIIHHMAAVLDQTAYCSMDCLTRLIKP